MAAAAAGLRIRRRCATHAAPSRPGVFKTRVLRTAVRYFPQEFRCQSAHIIMSQPNPLHVMAPAPQVRTYPTSQSATVYYHALLLYYSITILLYYFFAILLCCYSNRMLTTCAADGRCHPSRSRVPRPSGEHDRQTKGTRQWHFALAADSASTCPCHAHQAEYHTM
jgi:hypothetical protein